MLSLAAIPSIWLLLIGCKQQPQAAMRGDFVRNDNPNVAMKVTENTMIMTLEGNLLSKITSTYKVVEVHSNLVSVESSASKTTNGKVIIHVLSDYLVITNSSHFDGKWRRRN